jgi:hypothetical protein
MDDIKTSLTPYAFTNQHSHDHCAVSQWATPPCANDRHSDRRQSDRMCKSDQFSFVQTLQVAQQVSTANSKLLLSMYSPLQ